MSRGSPPTSVHCFHTPAFCLLVSQSQSYFCLMPPPCPITETYLAKSTYILVVAKLLDKFQSFLSQLHSMFDTDNLGPVFVIFHTFGFYDWPFFWLCLISLNAISPWTAPFLSSLLFSFPRLDPCTFSVWCHQNSWLQRFNFSDDQQNHYLHLTLFC